MLIPRAVFVFFALRKTRADIQVCRPERVLKYTILYFVWQFAYTAVGATVVPFIPNPHFKITHMTIILVCDSVTQNKSNYASIDKSE